MNFNQPSHVVVAQSKSTLLREHNEGSFPAPFATARAGSSTRAPMIAPLSTAPLRATMSEKGSRRVNGRARGTGGLSSHA